MIIIGEETSGGQCTQGNKRTKEREHVLGVFEEQKEDLASTRSGPSDVICVKILCVF